MEKEIQISTKSLQTGVNPYQQANKELKIRVLSDLQPLTETLRYCMALIGIKGGNLPSEAQRMVIIDFIKTHLGNFSCSEMKLAFQLAVAKKIKVNAKAYQSFDCVYIAEIMNSYKEYIMENKLLIEKEEPKQKELTIDEKEMLLIESYKELLREFMQFIDDGLIPKILIRGNGYLSAIYHALDRQGKIKLSKEEKKKIFESEKKRAELIHKRKKQEGISLYTTIEETAKINSRASVVKNMYLKEK